MMGCVVFAGEMQGTVHRLLLETRQNELKPGSVLLLKQVWGAALHPSCPGGAPRAVCVASPLPGRRQGVAGLVLDPGFLEPSEDLNPYSGGGWVGVCAVQVGGGVW